MTTLLRVGVALLPLTLAGCDLDQSFLFPKPVERVPGVQDLGLLTPLEITSETTPEDVRAATIFGEIGPTGSAELGGISFEFFGVGGSVCVWVDPELAWWNQSVSPIDPHRDWSEPDNLWDDGDLDLSGGLSVYYTGTPGVRMGDFKVRYEDSLGNRVPVDLVECVQTDYFGTTAGRAGRSAPEYCTIKDTLVGVKYTVAMLAFSLPPDDNRLGYGLILATGPCAPESSGGFGGANAGLRGLMGATADPATHECVIRGEAVAPCMEVDGKLVTPDGQDCTIRGPRAEAAGLPDSTWLGVDEVTSWRRSREFEDAFCNRTLRDFCRAERRRLNEEGRSCTWELNPVEVMDPLSNDQPFERCFCGDPNDTPDAGGI